MVDKSGKIVITGGAGLVGQNLVHELVNQGYEQVTVIDKHSANLNIIRELAPKVRVVEADLNKTTHWEEELVNIIALVQLHAQICGKSSSVFIQNNVEATKKVLRVAKQHGVPYLIHASSSVVNSVADDDYTRTKREQEELVKASGLKWVVLRPTLMFGWFDPKHLGWLARFMEKAPLFPIPGDGRFMRQPLYNRDFCRVIIKCIETQPLNQVFDLVGQTRIDYIDIIKSIRRVKRLNTPIVKIPIGLFTFLLNFYSLFSKNPPFTSDQLKALSAGDDFTGVNLKETFGVTPTDFYQALNETFTHPVYKDVELSR